MSDLKVKFIVL